MARRLSMLAEVVLRSQFTRGWGGGSDNPMGEYHNYGIYTDFLFYPFQAPKEPTPHLLPFMLPGVSSEQATLYRKVSKAMYGIHHNKEDATALVNIAQEW